MSKSFFSELKRRNVVRMAGLYLVGAWLLLQAASILFPTFEAPSWVMKVFVTAILLGFPAALLLSWALELTPEGIKRTEDAKPNESIMRKTGRKLAGLTIALAIIAGGLAGLAILARASHEHGIRQLSAPAAAADPRRHSR